MSDQASAARHPVQRQNGRAGPDTTLRCDQCGGITAVVDSRPTSLRGQGAVRRRRECVECRARLTTYEMRIDSSLAEDDDGLRLHLVAVTIYEAGRIVALARALANEMDAVLNGDEA